MKRLKIILIALLALSPVSLRASDIATFPTGPVYRITGLVWGTSTVPGFNNNYFFTPLSQNESVCAFVKNNNPTSSHTFNLSIVVTSDPSNATPSDGTWLNAGTGTALFTGISTSFGAGLGASVSGAAQVSINFSGSTTQAGSPDTASVTIIQTTGNCFSGQNVLGQFSAIVSTSPVIQSASDGLDTAFAASTAAVNPANGAEVIGINPGGGLVRSGYLDRLVISSSATATITVNTTTTAGTTCTGVTAVNEKGSGHIAAQMNVNTLCTGVPTAFFPAFSSISIPAGGIVTLDLRGFILPINSTNGLDVVMAAALTGTISLSLLWYEK